MAERVLVTGGAGFVGSNVIKELLSRDLEVIAVDNFSAVERDVPSIFDHDPRLEFYRADIRDMNTMDKLMSKCDYVIHEACKVVALSNKDPVEDLSVNAQGTLLMLQLAQKHNIKSFVYSSSASVYGNPINTTMKESDPPSPSSAYAISKLAGEHYVSLFKKLYGMNTVTLRYFNVYGPRQNAHAAEGGVIPIFINKLLEDKPLTIRGTGDQTRDFTYVGDVAKATVDALFNQKAFGEFYNIGSGVETSINEIVNTLSEIHGKEASVEHLPKRDIDDIERRKADVSKAQKDLGYEPTVNLAEGLRRTYEWHKNNEN